MPSYYHHSRVGSLSGAGAGAGGYYDQITDGVTSPAALNPNAMATAAYQQTHPPQHAHPAPAQAQAPQDAYAVGPPLTLGSSSMPAAVATSSGRLRHARTASVAGSSKAAGTVMVASSSSPSSSSSLGGRLGGANNYPVQQPAAVAAPTATLRASSGAWSLQDDEALVRARARGENWAQIQVQFPGKTPNACRKRHERLMERRNAANDFDARKMEQIAREYMQLRRDMWQPLAQRTGEKWMVVEQKCMNAGLKNLQGVSRSSSRRLRIESGYLGAGGGELSAALAAAAVAAPPYGDATDAHGVLLDGGEFLDGHVDGHLDGSSPGGSTGGGPRSVSVSDGSNSSSSVSVPATHPQHPQHQQHLGVPSRRAPAYAYAHNGAAPQQDVGSPGAYPDYYATTTGFSQSLRSLDGGPGSVAAAAGNGASMVSPYMGHQHGHHGQAAQHGARLSPDMGIDALLHRR